MTPAACAALHARVFTTPRPYSEAEFQAFDRDPVCFTCWRNNAGFGIGRVIGDEAELLTIAVDPDHQRKGIGRELLSDVEATARLRGVKRMFLEVSEENAAAIALYEGAGYDTAGRRPGYYTVEGQSHDALTMVREL